MKAIEIIKFAASAVTGIGVGKTVDLVLKENLPVNMNWKVRLATFIGSAAISGYISAKCSEHVEEEIDKVAEMVDKIKGGKLLENDDIRVEFINGGTTVIDAEATVVSEEN